MQRLTISIDDKLSSDFDALTKAHAYESRSEAVRDLVRGAVEAHRLNCDTRGTCVASLSYVYNHETRDLARRLTAMGHDQHHLLVSTMHVHLDHADCLETSILKGKVADIRAFADAVKAERGVRFAELNLIRVEPNDHHDGSGEHRHNSHEHLSPARS
jgi:CopG family nickel-responsive transcriptional regulator